MSTLEATVSILHSLSETDLLNIYDLARRVHLKQNKNTAPEPMTEEQLLRKLELSETHASEGKVMDADVAISKLRGKYGL